MSSILQLSKTELFQEITSHLMSDDRPSDYMILLSKQDELQGFPFHLLWRLKKTEQSKKYHPEGSVWNHTMMVLDEAAKVREKSSQPEAFMWAALLHDIGKPSTTRERKGKITSYDHDLEGERLCIEFLSFFSIEEDFIRLVSSLVRYHMHILYVLKELPHGNLKGLLKSVDINEIALLCRCDRLGRTGVDQEIEENEYQKFLQILNEQSK